MKKFKRTKFIALILVLTMIFPCVLIPGSSVGTEKIEIPNDPNDVKLLGYGYNITSGVALEGANSLCKSASILDMTSNQVLSNIESFEIGSHTKANSTTASTSREIATSIAQMTGGGIGVELPVMATISVDVEAIFQKNTFSSNTVKESYEYYHEEIIRREIILQLSNEELKQNLSKQFLNDAANVTSAEQAKTMITKYGTHLFTGYSLGGRLSFANYRQTVDSNENISSSTDLKAKIGAATKFISDASAQASFSFAEEYTNKEITSTATSEYSFQSIGGEAITALTMDHVFTYNPSLMDGKGGYVYNSWVHSVNNGTRLAILGLPNGARAIAIWDLLPDEPKYAKAKEALINVYVEICGDKYSEFLKDNPYLQSNDTLGVTGESLASINGFYYNFNTNFYNVAKDDISTHTVVPGSTVYMDFTSNISPDKLTWKIGKGASYATIVDEKSGVIRINADAVPNQEILIQLCDGNMIKDFITVKTSASRYSGGIGTDTYPYLISTADDFKLLARNSTDWSKSFRLTNDIDFGGAIIAGIGSESNPFSGTFDGNYCSVYNLTVNTPTNQALGLFCYNSGTIKNLTVGKSGTVTKFACAETTGAKFAGALVGINSGNITNCKAESTEAHALFKKSVEAQNAYAGGLIGYQGNGTVSSCAAISTVSFASVNTENYWGSRSYVYAGGFVGSASGGTITNCYTYTPKRIQAKVLAENTACAYQGLFAGIVNNTASVSFCIASLTDTSTAENRPYADAATMLGWTEEAKFGAFTGIFDKSQSAITNCYAKTGTNIDSTTTNVTSSNVVITTSNITYSFANSLSADVWVESTAGFPVVKSLQENYARLVIENDNTNFYKGSHWTPVGILASRVEADGTNTPIAFSIKSPLGVLSSISVANYDLEALNKKQQQKVSVVANDIVSIYAENEGSDKIYYGETFDTNVHTSGVKVYGTLTNGEQILLFEGTTKKPERSDVIYKNDSLKYNANINSVGNQTVTVIYGDLECEYLILCEERVLDRIYISNNPTRMEYLEGENFDVSGMKITAEYSDKSVADVPLKDIEIVGKIVSPGNNVINMLYQNKSCSLEIQGVDTTIPPATGDTDISGGNTTTPGGNTTTPGGNTTTPGGNTTTPDGNTTTPGGNTTTPGGNTTTPGGNTTTPGGNTTTPGGNTTTPSENTDVPNVENAGGGCASNLGSTFFVVLGTLLIFICISVYLKKDRRVKKSK